MVITKIVVSPQTLIFMTILLLFGVIVLGGVYLLTSIRETLETHDQRLIKVLHSLNITDIDDKN